MQVPDFFRAHTLHPQILMADNHRLKGKDLQEFAAMMAGPVGSTVKLLCGRGGRTFELEITREGESHTSQGRKIFLSMRGIDLDAKDSVLLGGKSDPYLIFRSPTGEEVFRTEVIKNNLNPVWNPFEIDLGKLCGNNLQSMFRLECWDKDFMTKDDMIGQIEVNVESLLKEQELQLRDKDKIRKHPKPPPFPGKLGISKAVLLGDDDYKNIIEKHGLENESASFKTLSLEERPEVKDLLIPPPLSGGFDDVALLASISR